MEKKHLFLILAIFLSASIFSTYLFWQGFILRSSYEFKANTQTNSISTKNVLSAHIATKSSDVKKQSFKVLRVIDGDTIEIDYFGSPTKLRYIGINTPETVDPRRGVECFGKEASNENKKLLDSQEVFLEKDISETDKFKRLLRYVYLSLNNGQMLMVNDYLVREGFAQVDTFPPDVKYSKRFMDAEEEARLNRRGLWQRC